MKAYLALGSNRGDRAANVVGRHVVEQDEVGAARQGEVELLQRIVQEERKALLLVTHNPEIAEACDWIHEMQDGLIVGSHPKGRLVQ